MLSDLNIHLDRAVADEHRPVTSNLPKAPSSSRRRPAAAARPVVPTIAVRPAYADEADLVVDLAALDSARPLSGDVLLALVDGWPVAAGSLLDGRVVANPMVPSADAVALLRQRMESLTRPQRMPATRRARVRGRLAT
jgi:hypothetical protein